MDGRALVKRALRRGALALALAAMPVAVAQADTTPAEPTAVVGATTPQAAQGIAAELRRRGLSVTAIPRIGALEVSGDDLAAVRAAVGRDPRVDWVEPSHDRSLFAVAPPAIDEETGRAYGWSVDGVRTTEALAMMSWFFPVTVAVIDSGIDVTHPDLAGRIGPTYDVLTRGTGVRDVVGHGTFVAGLISAIDGNGLGGRGVAGATRVLPIRITTTGTIKSADAAEGIIRAVDAGAGVINLSFGGATISEVEKSALAYAAKHDVLVVAAAGNSYQVTSPVPNPVQYPAAALGGVRGGWGQGLSVAATDPLGRRARFSTTNDFVSVAAPGAGSGECGDGVFSAIPAAPTLLWDDDSAGSCARVVSELSTPEGRYGYAEGTSFATPLVSGAAALARDVNPGLTAEQTADVIRRSAHQAVGTGWNAQTGWGVLDVAAAVALARAYDTIDPVPALAVLPRVGSLSVTLGGTDVAGPGSMPAGVATYRLERSSNGRDFSPAGAEQASPIHLEDAVPSGESRWYRGTVCDQVHNCAPPTVSGPVTSTAPARPAPRALSIARKARPRIRSVAAGRPRTCARCIRVAFTAKGASRLRWSVKMGAGAGVTRAAKKGTVPRRGRVVALLRLSRRPTCRGRIRVKITVRSGSVITRSSRSVRVRNKCVRRRGR